jgi:hypothetical protein
MEKEFRYGLTDDLNRIISTKSAVNQIPEKGSAILVHGGSFYDNVYLINHVPMFPPSHFINHPTLDISAVMVGVLEDVTIKTARIGGTYANAAGCVVTMEPGIYRPASDHLKQRPELVVNMSTRKIEFTLSTPLRKKKLFTKRVLLFAMNSS